MNDQVQTQLTISEFLLQQRRLIDQIVLSYENNISQLVGMIDELNKENQQLKSPEAPPAQA